MKPTDGILVALTYATFEDEDLKNIVMEVVAQLDSDLEEANYDCSTEAEKMYNKFDEFMKDFIADQNEDDEDSDDDDEDDEDEDIDDENEDEDDDEDEDEDDTRDSGWFGDEDED